MITDVKVTSTLNLSIDDEIYNFRSLHLPETLILAGVRWTVVDESAYEALLTTVKIVYDLIAEQFPDWNMWLLIGDSAWQTDTKIIRYRKLWGTLAARDIKVSHTSNSLEIIHKTNGKIKFFGATQLSELSLKSIVKILLQERCTYLLALPFDLEPQSFLETGWSGDLRNDSLIISCSIKTNGLLIKQFGEFDDNERGLVAFGNPKTVSTLLQS